MEKNVLVLNKGWWKEERKGSSRAIEIHKHREKRIYGVGTKWLSTKESAQELGVSVWTLYKYIRSRELYAVPKKKGYQIPAQAIQDFREDILRMKRAI